MNRILVVNVNWLGDVIFSIPVFKALRSRYPQAKISCLAVPRVKAILESCPFLDEIITYDEKGRHFAPWGKWQIITQLRKRRFDAAFLLHGSWTRALLVFLSGIPERVGYNTKGRKGLLTHIIPAASEKIHRSDYYLRVIESYGVPVSNRRYETAVSSQIKAEATALLADNGINSPDYLILINTGGNWDLKRWPRENFAALIAQLMDLVPNTFKMKIALPGSNEDLGLAKEIARLSQREPIILAGKTNLPQLLALMQRANLVISADSGPLHMASSVGTTTIALFGPTRPENTGPRGPGTTKILQHDVGCNRASCYYLDCPDNICMQAISVEEVVEEVQRIMKQWPSIIPK